MFSTDVHVALAVLVTLATVAATVEGAVRVVRPREPGLVTERTRSAVVLLVGVSGASGLALIVTGHRPHEWLHLVYAVLALGLVPIADNAASEIRSARGRGLVRLAGGLVSLVVLVRLAQTG